MGKAENCCNIDNLNGIVSGTSSSCKLELKVKRP